jgi:hypothetical protein
MPEPDSRYQVPLAGRGAVVAPGNENVFPGADESQSSRNVEHAADTGGVACSADENEVIVHDRKTLQTQAFCNKPVLRWRVVDK